MLDDLVERHLAVLAPEPLGEAGAGRGERLEAEAVERRLAESTSHGFGKDERLARVKRAERLGLLGLASRDHSLSRRRDEPVAQLLEADPGGLGGHREERGVGQARHGVHLEHLGPVVAQDQVDADEAGAVERLPGRDGGVSRTAASSSPSSAGQMKSVRPIS